MLGGMYKFQQMNQLFLLSFQIEFKMANMNVVLPAVRVHALMPLNLNCSANQKNKGKQCRLQQRGMIEIATLVPHDLDKLSLQPGVYSGALRKTMVNVNVMQRDGATSDPQETMPRILAEGGGLSQGRD